MTSSPIHIVATGLPHPEGVAFDGAGQLFTGTAVPDHVGRGPIHRVGPQGAVEYFADTGGRALGLAFGPDEWLYVCDAGLSAIIRVSPTGELEDFARRADGRALQLPNFAVFDRQGQLYVSDSGTATAGERTAAVYRYDAEGRGELVADGLVFANGLALDRGEGALYVAETRDDRILRIPLRGSDAGDPQVFADRLTSGPDGLAFDAAGNLLVTLTGTDSIVSVSPEGQPSLVAKSTDGRLRAPSNIAFSATGEPVIYVANVLGDHISRLSVEFPGAPLAFPARRDNPGRGGARHG